MHCLMLEAGSGLTCDRLSMLSGSILTRLTYPPLHIRLTEGPYMFAYDVQLSEPANSGLYKCVSCFSVFLLRL